MKRLLTAVLMLSGLLFAVWESTGIVPQDDTIILTPTPLAVREVSGSYDAAWSVQGNWLVVVDRTNARLEADRNQNQFMVGAKIEVWDPFSVRENVIDAPREFQPEAGEISLLAFSPDGTRLAALSYVNLTVFDTATGQSVFSRMGAPTYFLEWSPDSTQIAVQSTSDYFSLELIDAATGNTLNTYQFFETARIFRGAVLQNVSWGSPHEIAVIAPGDHRAVLNFRTNVVTDVSDCCSEGAYVLEWQPSGRLLATHDRVYDLDTRQQTFSFPTQYAISWSPDGQWLVGTNLREVSLISVVEQRVVLRFSPAALGGVTSAEWSHDGQYLLINSGINGMVGETFVSQDYVSIWNIQQMMADAGYTAAQ